MALSNWMLSFQATKAFYNGIDDKRRMLLRAQRISWSFNDDTPGKTSLRHISVTFNVSYALSVRSIFSRR